MEDQVKHEAKRYEKLKSAIITEEKQDQEKCNFHPDINQKSVKILKKANLTGSPDKYIPVSVHLHDKKIK